MCMGKKLISIKINEYITTTHFHHRRHHHHRRDVRDGGLRGVPAAHRHNSEGGDNNNPGVRNRPFARRRRSTGGSRGEFVWPQQYPLPRTQFVKMMAYIFGWTTHIMDWLSLLNLWPNDCTLLFKTIPWDIPPPVPPLRPRYNVIEPDC